ncbi:MAG: hypothetical protein E5W60_07470, partial [Mesorhizobium sp.]
MKTSRFIASGIGLSPNQDRPNNDRLAGNCFALYEADMTKSEKPTIFRAEHETLKVTLLVFSG